MFDPDRTSVALSHLKRPVLPDQSPPRKAAVPNVTAIAVGLIAQKDACYVPQVTERVGIPPQNAPRGARSHGEPRLLDLWTHTPLMLFIVSATIQLRLNS